MTLTAPHDSKTSDLRRQGLALAIVGLGGFAADYGFNVGLSRLLDAHEFGDFRVAHSFASFLGVTVLLGGDRAAPKVLSVAFEAGRLEDVWAYLRFYGRLALALSAAVIAVTWIAAGLHLGSTDPEHHHAVAWVAPAIPCIALGALISRALQASHHPLRASLPWRIVFPLAQLVTIAAFAAITGAVDVQEAIALGVVVVVAIDLWQWWDLRRLELPRPQRPSPRGAVVGGEGRAWLRHSLPMMGAFLVALALNQSDLYFLEALGDEDEVGHYAAAATSAHFLLVIQGTILGLLAPRIQPALDRGLEAARTIYRHGQRLLLGFAAPSAVVLALGARPVLSLFGSGYTVAETELVALVVGNLAWAAASLSAIVLQYARRAGLVLSISIATLVLDAALDWLLIPTYGMRGAAVSTAATLTLAAVALLVARRRVLAGSWLSAASGSGADDPGSTG